MAANKLSFICVAFNIISVLGFFLIPYIPFLDNLLGTLLLGMILFSPFLAFSRILLGIGAIVLKEPLLKCISAIALNS